MTRTKKAPARILKEGRVTIPKSTRRELGLEYGDFVLVSVEPIEED